MFTGIVAHLGTVEAVDATDGLSRLRIDAGHLSSGLTVGGSVAVNGVCLTAVDVSGPHVMVEVMAETARRSTLGELAPGDGVNLERPVGPDGLFEGHIVQGHVDGTATVVDVSPDGDARVMRLSADDELTRYVVEKGSVALDGVSLTVTDTSASGFAVALIPHTLSVTTLGRRGAGGKVNVEVDVIAKYVERLVS